MASTSDIDPRSRSRLPLLERDELDADGQRLYDAVAGPDSRTLVGLKGPSGIWLHSPKLGAHARAVNQYLRFETGLDARLRELAILVTARENDSQFEWSVHEPVALREGVDPALVDAVKHRRPVTTFPTREALIVDMGRQLFRDRTLRATTYAEAVKVFGRRGLLDLVALMGNYAMTAVILSAFDQQLAPDQPPLLPMGGASTSQ